MEYIKILAVGFVTLFAVLLVRQIRSDFAIIIGVAGSIIMLILISDQIASIIGYLNEVLLKTKINPSIVSCLFKIIGIGYIAEFSSSICNDAGCGSIGEKILFYGKIAILGLSIPIITGLIDLVIGLLP